MRLFVICSLLIFSFHHEEAWSQSKHQPLTIILENHIEHNSYYIAGDFTNWKIEALDLQNGRWIYETKLVPNNTYQYFFLHDADWSAKEPMIGECFFKDEHRLVQMTPFLKELDHKYGKCTRPTDKTGVYVESLFKLKTPASDTHSEYYIVGNFTDWIPKPMQKVSKNKFNIRLKIPKGYAGKYFYLAGDTWKDREPFPGSSCTQQNDRYFDPSVEERVVFNDMYGDCGG